MFISKSIDVAEPVDWEVDRLVSVTRGEGAVTRRALDRFLKSHVIASRHQLDVVKEGRGVGGGAEIGLGDNAAGAGCL